MNQKIAQKNATYHMFIKVEKQEDERRYEIPKRTKISKLKKTCSNRGEICNNNNLIRKKKNENNNNC